MRIGIVCPYSFDEPGGVQAHVIDLAAALEDRGHTVRVIGPGTREAAVPSFVELGGRAFPVRYNGSVARLAFGPHVLRRMRRFIRNGRFDVLHIHEPNSPSYSMHALFAAHGPLVATYHAYSSGSFALQVARRFLAPQLEKIRGGIAVSDMARRWQVEQLGGDPVLIPNGVDTRRFHAARRPPSTVPEIVFLGRLDEPRKGLDILLAALRGLDRTVRVTVIGVGEPRRVDNVEFLGRVTEEEKAQILGRADIYVAPNTGGESFGIVLVEAMAAGCAVVASDLEAFAAVVGDAGRLFPTGSSATLARILQELIDDPAQRRRLADQGQKRAQLYDWSEIARRVLAVYETVADGTSVTTRRR